ncbi:MAG TPA: filamentous hemagglutinin N-terminal domain-containing protein [Leptolyngbyaceae cyanobacterium]
MKTYLVSSSILGIASLFCLFPIVTTAQIVPDGTLPVNSIVTPQGNINLIEGGTKAGSNLFHSFQEFSIPTGSEAFFNNAVDINNIFTRVTGSSISNIDGLIKANGTANLFFLNPNGIVFGANAQLNIGGSFLASTASGIRFADGTEFNTTPNQNTSLLTINVPVGLQYSTNPGSLTVQGQGLPLPRPVDGETIAQQAARNIQLQQEWLNSPVGLGVQPGRTLALVGGNMALEGGILKAPSGRIEIGSVADAGVVSLNLTEQGWALGYANIPAFGNVQLSQLATMIASGEGGGDIQVQGGRVALSGESRILADTLGSQNGGTVSIQALALSLVEGSRITASTINQGTGGNLIVKALEFVELIGTSVDTGYPSGLEAETFVSGAAGSLTINTGRLVVRDGASVSTYTGGTGQGGNLFVNATEAVEVSGTKPKGNPGGLFSRAFGIGKAGDLTIQTRKLSLENGAEISTYGGNLLVQATDSVEVLGTGPIGFPQSTLSTKVLNGEEGLRVTGGNLIIETGKLSIRDGGEVSTSIDGQADAGNLLIRATELVEVVGEGPDFFLGGLSSNISSDVGSDAVGKGGNIIINTPMLSIRNGGQVSAQLYGKGQGGDIQVKADFVEIVEASRVITFGDFRIRSSSEISTSVLSDGDGQGGSIEIDTNILRLSDGGRLGSGILGKGNAGSIQVRANERMEVVGVAKDDGLPSMVEAVVSGQTTNAQGGRINIETPMLSIRDGGLVAAATNGLGNAGSIEIRAKDAVELIGGSIDNVTGLTTSVFPSAKGEGGSLTLETERLTMTGYSTISAGTTGDGNAGNILVRANVVELSGDSRIEASSFLLEEVPGLMEEVPRIGNGGTIRIETGRLQLNDDSSIAAFTYSSASGGSITVDASKSVQLSGNTRLTTSALAAGDARDLTVKTGELIVRDGAGISASTSGTGNAGNLTIIADLVELAGIRVREDGEVFPSRLNALSEGDGAAGSLRINTGRLIVRDGAGVSASNTGLGKAGNLNVTADSIVLDNNGKLDATTAAGNQGNINIDSQSLILRRGSQINTNATDTATGGNININTNTLAALDNSDISANSVNAQGGTVIINSQAIFGAQVRTRDELIRLLETDVPALLAPSRLPSSDITATGKDASLSGTVAVNTPDINPGAGLVELSENLVDATALVTSSCRARGNEQSRFTVTGRGGLPPTPDETISDEATWMDLRPIAISQSTQPNRSSTSSLPSSPHTRQTPEIVEAQGWTVNEKGQITLVAQASRVTAFATGLGTHQC